MLETEGNERNLHLRELGRKGLVRVHLVRGRGEVERREADKAEDTN